MDSSVEREFCDAAEFIRRSKMKVSNDEKLQFYGLFKQASEGKCSVPKPSFFDMVGRSKWNAWNSLGDLDRTKAAQDYIALVTKLAPTWRDEELPVASGDESQDQSSTFGVPSVSTMAAAKDDSEVAKTDAEKSLMDWCVEGNIEKVRQKLAEDRSSLSLPDSEGLTPLHWACDRGHAELVQTLLEHGAPLNTQDQEGQTALHYAVTCEHVEVVRQLVAAGADVTICDLGGMAPSELADKDSIREALQSTT